MMAPAKGGSTMRIGFVGTGTMGTPIAGCLIRAGHSLSVYDRRPEATAALCAQGAVRADSAFAAARDSEVVFTSLPGPAEFEAAMLEPQTGILAGLQPGAAHIDLTTNAPKTDRPRRRGLPVARGRTDRCAGQRPPAGDDRDDRRQRRCFRQVSAIVRGHRRQCLPCRPERRRGDRQAGDAVPGLHQLHRLDRRDARRGQGRDRPRHPGPDRAGQRRAKPHLRQHRPRRVPGHLRCRRHARHRRQGR